MARPIEYDDTWLLRTTAELIVSGEATTRAAAQRKAVSFIIGSEHWQDHVRQQVLARLKKAYTTCGADLERAANDAIQQRQKSMPWLSKFVPPTFLELPLDPRQMRLAAEARELEDGLRNVGNWATEKADLLRKQAFRDEISHDLLIHARELVGLVRK